MHRGDDKVTRLRSASERTTIVPLSAMAAAQSVMPTSASYRASSDRDGRAPIVATPAETSDRSNASPTGPGTCTIADFTACEVMISDSSARSRQTDHTDTHPTGRRSVHEDRQVGVVGHQTHHAQVNTHGSGSGAHRSAATCSDADRPMPHGRVEGTAHAAHRGGSLDRENSRVLLDDPGRQTPTRDAHHAWNHLAAGLGRSRHEVHARSGWSFLAPRRRRQLVEPFDARFTPPRRIRLPATRANARCSVAPPLARDVRSTAAQSRYAIRALSAEDGSY